MNRYFIYNISEWVTRLVYLNVLWGFFSLVGLIAFGFFPATTAMFAICRDWLRGKTGIPVFKSFWKYYRKDFLRSNLLGLIISLITLIIIADITFIFSTSNELIKWAYIPLSTIILLFILFLLYVFPIFVHYDLTIIEIVKTSFLVIFANPLTTLLIFISLAAVLVLMKLIPALAFVFGGSSVAYIIMSLCLFAFNKVSTQTE